MENIEAIIAKANELVVEAFERHRKADGTVDKAAGWAELQARFGELTAEQLAKLLIYKLIEEVAVDDRDVEAMSTYLKIDQRLHVPRWDKVRPDGPEKNWREELQAAAEGERQIEHLTDSWLERAYGIQRAEVVEAASQKLQ